MRELNLFFFTFKALKACQVLVSLKNGASIQVWLTKEKANKFYAKLTGEEETFVQAIDERGNEISISRFNVSAIVRKKTRWIFYATTS